MVRVTVSTDVLRWARQRSGVSIQQLSKKLPRVAEWETGETRPTLRQLETYARATLTPLGYLFLAEPPDDQLPIPHFRTVRDQAMERPSPNLLETVYEMLRRQDWLRDYLIDQGVSPLDFVGSHGATDDPSLVAKDMRRVLGVSGGWASSYPTWTSALSGLISMAEDAGIVVTTNGVVGNDTHRKLDPDEFRGFVLTDEYAPLVFINGADFKTAQMFTLAHELAHVWIGRSAAFDLRAMQPANDSSEQACNRIAAEFLVPANELRSEWARHRDLGQPYAALARRFKVSAIVVARRALDLTLIDRSEFFDFYNAERDEQRVRAANRSPGADFWAVQDGRISRRFAEAVVRATRQGRLLYQEAYGLTGLRGETFDRLTQRVQGLSA